MQKALKNFEPLIVEFISILIQNNQTFNLLDVIARFNNLVRADSNIDHRRVPNLETYFSKHGIIIPISNDIDDYQPGDIITWD